MPYSDIKNTYIPRRQAAAAATRRLRLPQSTSLWIGAANFEGSCRNRCNPRDAPQLERFYTVPFIINLQCRMQTKL